MFIWCFFYIFIIRLFVVVVRASSAIYTLLMYLLRNIEVSHSYHYYFGFNIGKCFFDKTS